MTQKFYVNNTTGEFIGSYDGPDEGFPDHLIGAVQVPTLPNVNQIWDLINEEWVNVTPPPIPKVPELFAIADTYITNYEISGIEASTGLSSAFQLDTGKYWFFFNEDQGNTSYIPLAYNGGSVRCYVEATDKFTDSFIVTTVDSNGSATDTEHLSIEVKRIV